MTKEELRQKCTERAKIFQQAMESCHSSNPMDCIEWFADRIAELEKENAELKEELKQAEKVKVVERFEAYGQCRDSRRIAELESQIEKMKCCYNCDFVFRDGNCYYDKECKNKDHWKLRR